MARLGVDYELIKQAAIKLLSQGTAPSVQKIREVLGTGSNTTIAEHLKVWRDEYAKKTTHYLPANMPKELISTFEVLWQTAMEQAQNQLTEYKYSLESEHEIVLQSQRDMGKVIADLKEKLTVISTKLEEELIAKQKISVELAVINDRLEKREEAFVTQKNQYEDSLKRIYTEKENIIEHSHHFQNEIKILQEKFTLQTEEHKRFLTQLNSQQEQSEVRWLKLIDQARQETKEERKKSENLRYRSEEQLKKIDLKLTDAQKSIYEKDTQLKIYLEQINFLNNQLKEVQTENTKAKSIIANLERERRLKTVKMNTSTV